MVLDSPPEASFLGQEPEVPGAQGLQRKGVLFSELPGSLGRILAPRSCSSLLTGVHEGPSREGWLLEGEGLWGRVVLAVTVGALGRLFGRKPRVDLVMWGESPISDAETPCLPRDPTGCSSPILDSPQDPSPE